MRGGPEAIRPLGQVHLSDERVRARIAPGMSAGSCEVSRRGYFTIPCTHTPSGKG